jgi:murein L,D-transpeptidase YcbB/YkuD
MRKARFDRLLAATALALTLTSYGSSVFAETAAASTKAVATATSTDPAATEATTPAQAAPEAAKSPPAATESSKPVPVSTELTSAVPAGDAAKATARSIADTAIVDKLREQLTAGKFDRILGGKKERGALETFYAGREFAPLWITDGAMNERAKAAAKFLSRVDADGLEPSDYPVPEFKSGAAPEALAEAEIRFTDTILTFTRHAQTGRVHFSRVAGDILFNPVKPEPADVLAKLAGAKDIGEALDSYNPQQPGYKALKAKLAELRHAPLAAPAKADEKEVERARVPDGALLRPGMKDQRVVAVRKRLDIDGDKNNQAYDDAVFEAVKAFQTEADITVDGMLGPNTVRAMNGEKPAVRRPAIDPADVVIANMERWRWLPRDLGKTYVMVNIPDYTLRVVRNDKLVWKTKIVVGKPNLPTPMTSAEMKFITVNPTWNVPPSIIQNEYLPALQQDPQAMERIGLKVEQNPDGTVRIWQPPGDKNALGRIRFNFPNKFLVYQHDTPDKYLFAKEARAYSHGCMRVENPLKYGEVLLSLALPQEHYTEDRLRKMFGGAEININFPTTIPVHLTYQTAFVDEQGKLVIRDDVYGRDVRQLAVMKGSDRRVADIAIERPRNNSSAPVRMPPGSFGGGGLFSGPSFFERLFGGGSAEASAPRPNERVGRANDRHRMR